MPVKPLSETYQALGVLDKTKEQWILIEAVAKAAIGTLYNLGPGQILDAVDMLTEFVEEEVERSPDLVFIRESINAEDPDKQKQKKDEYVKDLLSLYLHLFKLMELKEISQEQAFAEERAAQGWSPKSPSKAEVTLHHADCGAVKDSGKKCTRSLGLDDGMIPNYRLGMWSARYNKCPILMRLSEITTCGVYNDSDEGIINPYHLDFEILDNQMERQWDTRIHWTWTQIYYYDDAGPHLLNPNSFPRMIESIANCLRQKGIMPDKSKPDPEVQLFLGRRCQIFQK